MDTRRESIIIVKSKDHNCKVYDYTLALKHNLILGLSSALKSTINFTV